MRVHQNYRSPCKMLQNTNLQDEWAIEKSGRRLVLFFLVAWFFKGSFSVVDLLKSEIGTWLKLTLFILRLFVDIPFKH